MVERVRTLINSRTPFLIVKYKVSFIGMMSNCYDIVTMYGDKLQYYPLERRDVMRVLKEFSYLYSMMRVTMARYGEIRNLEKNSRKEGIRYE